MAGGAGGGLLASLRRMDAFPKTLEDFRVKTTAGGCVSLLALAVMLLLALSEVSFHLGHETFEHLRPARAGAERVRQATSGLWASSSADSAHDKAAAHKKETAVHVEFDISFPEVPCSLLSIDAADALGVKQQDVVHSIFKKRIDHAGRALGRATSHAMGNTITTEEEIHQLHAEHSEKEGERILKDRMLAEAPANKDKDKAQASGGGGGNSGCGDCYGAGEEGQCCKTCQEVRELYQKKGWAFNPGTVTQCQQEGFENEYKDVESEEGCSIFGDLNLHTASGNFHIAPHKDFHRGGIVSGMFNVMDLVSYTFDEFNITHTIHKLNFGPAYPGKVEPLEGETRTVQDGHGMYQYYLKLVPTDYKYLHRPTVTTNQYSATEHLRHTTPGTGRGLPGVYFYYETAPIEADIVVRRRGILKMITSLCAIVGACFTIFGIVDRIITHFTKNSPY